MRYRNLVLFVLFGVTGFSALTLQVVWQRVLSMHAGVDLFSVTTIITSFMAGLGLGNLLGGYVADRLGPHKALLAFAASNACIGLFGWLSLWLFYDIYRSVVPYVSGVGSAFLFHFVLLIVPTTLMGLSLPLISRGVVREAQEIAPLVGRLYAVNTLGAAAGAAVSGWWILGTFGFVGAVRMAATLNLLAAVLILTLWRSAGAERTSETAAPIQPLIPSSGSQSRVWPWYVLFGLTGCVALGLEILFFRIIDALMRSNSYTFGHVLSLYLLIFAIGAAVGSRRAARVAHPDRWFLWLQFGVGLSSLVGPLSLMKLLPRLGMRELMKRYFSGGGFITYSSIHSGRDLAQLLFAHLLGPLLVMGVPVFLMGASFPFIQALVARRLDTLGRRTGALLFSNICGNVAGSAIVGFMLLDRVGTPGTLKLLAALLLLPGLIAAALAQGRMRRLMPALSITALIGGILLFPSNASFWAFFHSSSLEDLSVTEDRACVNALVNSKGNLTLHINGSPQNGYPYDDFHLLIGLTPALMHPDPRRAMAVGLGIGATAYGMAQDPRLYSVECVEICSGEFNLIQVLAERGSVESQRLLTDPRIRLFAGDGRKFLLAATEPFDVITVDALRPTSAYSGNVYSVEFYELIRSRLTPTGLFSQWSPTARTWSSMVQVFPYVVAFELNSATYGVAHFMVAGQGPIVFDRQVLLKRFQEMNPDRTFTPQQVQEIMKFLSTAKASPVRNGDLEKKAPEHMLNRDLFPRDEYFLNNP